MRERGTEREREREREGNLENLESHNFPEHPVGYAVSKSNSFFQRNCILKNIRQEIYAKIEVRVVPVYRQTALTTNFALLSQLENRRQLCVCFDPKDSCLIKMASQTYILSYYNISGLSLKVHSSTCSMVL